MRNYYNCRKKRRLIDELLHENAKYQAQNIGGGTTPEEKVAINDYCYENFILPIKDIDEVFFDSISKQSD